MCIFTCIHKAILDDVFTHVFDAVFMRYVLDAIIFIHVLDALMFMHT